jgi:hypothetical protein
VFVYRAPGDDFTSHDIMRMERFIYLLGIQWGQFPELWEFERGLDGEASRRQGLVVEGAYIKGMSGMTCVIPAWWIDELLDRTGMYAMISNNEAKLRSGRSKKKLSPDAESAVEPAPPATEGDEQHKERFTALLNAAARKKPQGD